MNSRNLLKIKSKLKKYLKQKEILDIIVFGSAVKGKAVPNDVDIAIISDKDLKINIKKFHISILSYKDFFIKSPRIINTLFKEGYSLRHNKFLSEVYNFSNKILFKYELSNLKPSIKVKIVNVLRGKNKQEGMVKENKGEWLANQVFIAPIESNHLFESFFINFKVKFNKFHVLIH